MVKESFLQEYHLVHMLGRHCLLLVVHAYTFEHPLVCFRWWLWCVWILFVSFGLLARCVAGV